jgi:hypothetical protein
MRTDLDAKVKHFARSARAIATSCARRADGRCARARAREHGARVATATIGTRMTALEDGAYDAFVVWAERRGDGIALELTITAGAHRGEVVNIVTSAFAARDPFDVVGVPCTLIVDGDELRVRA